MLSHIRGAYIRRSVAIRPLTICLLLAGVSCFYYPQYKLNHEGAADSMRKIKAAEAKFKESTGRYGDLKELAAAGLIDSTLAGGVKFGYRVEVRPRKESYVAVALPVEYGNGRPRGTGIFSLYLDETGVTRGSDRGGGEAKADDLPLGEDYQ